MNFLERTWLFIRIPDLISMRLFSSVSVWLLYILKMQFSMVRFVGESDVPVCVGGQIKVSLSLSCESCQACNVNRVIRTKEERLIGRNVRIHKADDCSLRYNGKSPFVWVALICVVSTETLEVSAELPT